MARAFPGFVYAGLLAGYTGIYEVDLALAHQFLGTPLITTWPNVLFDATYNNIFVQAIEWLFDRDLNIVQVWVKAPAT